jgi:hypothetical protein
LSYQSRRDAERIVAENLAANNEKDQLHMLKWPEITCTIILLIGSGSKRLLEKCL